MESFMDSRKLVCIALLALVTGVSHADGFFVNTSLGVDNFYPKPYNDNINNLYSNQADQHSHTEALRIGYRWNSDPFSYGLETGYVNLGSSYLESDGAVFPLFDHYRERIDGALLGPTLKYALPMGFFVSARGGVFWSTDHEMSRSTFEPPAGLPFASFSNEYHSDISGTGNYVGLGVGYDFNQSLGLSLNYDRYRPHVVSNWWEHGGLLAGTPRVDTYTVTAEYRF
jgi:OmpA-OmpF porin, OOP family